jgi:hypothetical protein
MRVKVKFKPFQLWVKRPEAPRRKSILLDFYRCTFDDGLYRIELFTLKGIDLIVNAFQAKDELQFGLARDGVGRLFRGRVTEYSIEIGRPHGAWTIAPVTFCVSAAPFIECEIPKK